MKEEEEKEYLKLKSDFEKVNPTFIMLQDVLDITKKQIKKALE